MTNHKTKELTQLAILTALSVALAYIHVPSPTGFLTLLDVGVYFTAFYLGSKAGAIVGGLAGFLILGVKDLVEHGALGPGDHVGHHPVQGESGGIAGANVQGEQREEILHKLARAGVGALGGGGLGLGDGHEELGHRRQNRQTQEKNAHYLNSNRAPRNSAYPRRIEKRGF